MHDMPFSLLFLPWQPGSHQESLLPSTGEFQGRDEPLGRGRCTHSQPPPLWPEQLAQAGVSEA